MYAVYGLLFLDPLLGRSRSGSASTALQVLRRGVRVRASTGETLRPLWTLPLQQFVYRQLMYLVVIQRVTAVRRATGWHKLRRARVAGSVGDARIPLARRAGQPIWRSAPSQYGARISRLSSLPDGLRGSSLAKSTDFGSL